MRRTVSKGTLAETGPSFMSERQMGEYLKELRDRPVPRPNGSRAYPGSLRRTNDIEMVIPTPNHHSSSSSTSMDSGSGSRSSKTMSHRQSLRQSLSMRYSFDQVAEQRNGSHDKRHKGEDDFGMEDEERVDQAARTEAMELIRKHEHPNAPYRLERSQTEPLRNELEDTRASEADALPKTSNKQLIGSLEGGTGAVKKQSSFSKLANFWNGTGGTQRRSSGSKRSFSGSKQRAAFPNAEEKIYEDPTENSKSMNDTEREKASIEPHHVRKNPFARAHFAKQSISKSSRSAVGVKGGNRQVTENSTISKATGSDPTEPHPALYKSQTEPVAIGDSNTPEEPRYINGIEVRGDDMRAATSMRRSDRSPNLPSPTAVSDKPGRPIVSFKKDWMPPEEETNLEQPKQYSPSRSSPFERRTANRKDDLCTKASTAPSAPSLQNQDSEAIQVNNGRLTHMPNLPDQESSSSHKAPDIPQINVSEIPEPSTHASASPNHPPIPTINAPDVPTISVAPPSPETKRVPKNSQGANKRPSAVHSSTEPIPDRSRHNPFNSQVRGTQALCAQCALPIAGKTVSAAGLRFHPGCFTCHHCNTALECVAFYPEPDNAREKRLDRIYRRMEGEEVEDKDGENEDDDEDDSLRFYCHLDFHELFSPRCKSCKTPIEGEVVVALGAEWHVGHFFCAECGDPFDPTTPFVEKDGWAWCIRCHTNRYSTKCKRCRRPVTETVVKALGAEWHVECFRCLECNGNFDDGRYFVRGEGKGDPVCGACEERRLKA